jgi:threonine aldolase
MEFICRAQVGDDVYGEDPSVNELQDYMAELSGKESALFVPSGVMGNQLALKALTDPGDEVIIESQAHIFYYETAAPSIISQIQLRCIDSDNGEMIPEKIKSSIRTPEYYLPKTKVIALENTHNRHGGSILSLDYIHDVHKIAKDIGIKFHLDGARLWNASAATGISIKDYCNPFDTISICLSKGMGAPVGSVLVSDAKTIEKAHKWRKILGGGMRQSGILASAGLYALKNNFHLLKGDHENAQHFAKKLADSPLISVNLSKVQTNMVFFDLITQIDVNLFIQNCLKQGLSLMATGPKTIRAVFHFQVSSEQSIDAASIIHNEINNLSLN